MIPFLQPKTIEHHLEPKNCNQYYFAHQLLQFPIHLAEYLFAKYTSDVHVSCNQLFCHNDHHPAASNAAVQATNNNKNKNRKQKRFANFSNESFRRLFSSPTLSLCCRSFSSSSYTNHSIAFAPTKLLQIKLINC